MLEHQAVTRLVDSVPFWWHSIDLGDGIVTPGRNSLEFLRSSWSELQLPDLTGKTVLDIGAWDGFFSFEAEMKGASRVVALDHYVWSLDLRGQQEYWERCKRDGVDPRPYHETEFWKPKELPGKRGFDVAKLALHSDVECVVDDFAVGDPERFGRFDVVLCLGVLYHMEDPLGALRRIARMTKETCVISTQAVHLAAFEGRCLFEFYPGGELNHDVSNWWAPNLKALHGLCRAAGFAEVRTIEGPTDVMDTESDGLSRYRAIVHASA